MLIQNPNWDHNTFFDPLSTTIEHPATLPDEIPFAKTKELAVNIPINNLGKADIYIDDTIGIALDIDDNVKRVSAAIPLAIHTLTRLLDSFDKIPRKEIISLKKFLAEGRPSEVMTVLGWVLNTRTLRLSLPDDKYKIWSQEITSILSKGRVSHSTMESLIGRLNHVGFLMDMLRHFMSRLRQALQRTTLHRFTYLRNSEKADLGLLLHFLYIASTKGVSMNNLSYRKPTHLYRSDASLFGVGGYNILSGRAWHFQIPVDCRLRTSLNSLEFIAALISIWIDVLHGDIIAESCILSQTDSTSAAGWLKKSNFADSEDEIVQLTTAHQLAHLILEAESCLFSQWFPGDQNNVSDACSRDIHLNDTDLTKLILTLVPNQVPFGFKICPLPNEIISWLTCLLQNQPQKKLVEPATNSKQTLAWNRFKQYLKSISISSDPFLDNFTRYQRIKILGAFAHALREGRFNPKRPNTIKSDSCRATIDCVAQTFRLANRQDPRLDEDGKSSLFLQRQFRGYKKLDKPEKQQVILTGSVIRELHKMAFTPLDTTMCQLFTGAFFFAMRSCEYLKVSGHRRTKILTLCNVCFFKGCRELNHSDKSLQKADSVSITFEYQKKDTRNDIVTHHRSGHASICPVIVWAKIIQRIRKYPKSKDNTPVNTFMDNKGHLHQITGPQLLKRIRLAAVTIGKDILGFSPTDIGLHSARSGAAMAMYLSGVPIYTIMLLGRWSSDAFLRYIRKQVKEFSKDISRKMLTKDQFFTIPTTSTDDPRSRGHTLNIDPRNNNSLCFNVASRSLLKTMC
jgi:hypothetical protein